jgi:hypothetical protein
MPNLDALDVERLKLLVQQPDLRNMFGLLTNSDIPLFETNSGGPTQVATRNTIKAATQTFPLLVDLIEATSHESFIPIPLDSFPGSEAVDARSAQNVLKDLFNKYGSDKAINSYHHLYGTILRSPSTITDILEIGVGTNNEDVASNMGPGGKPGASLRAFGEYLPHARIFGADIDKRILFQEKNIQTFFVDQTEPETLEALGSSIKRTFDLIIDDGLHSANANVASLIFAIKYLKDRGWFVVEDIPASKLPVWQVVSKILPQEFASWIVEYPLGGLLFVVRRNKFATGRLRRAMVGLLRLRRS